MKWIGPVILIAVGIFLAVTVFRGHDFNAPVTCKAPYHVVQMSGARACEK